MKYKEERDYNFYKMTVIEIIVEYTIGIGICMIIALLFYKSFIAFFCLLPASYVYVKQRKKQKIKKRKERLHLEFLEGIKSIAAALNAGYSIENSFYEAYKDLSLLYSEKADIMQEFSFIIRKLQMNCTVETALRDFAKRSGIEDIWDFSEVFIIAKRTGGDIIKIIKNTCKIMEKRMEMQREIDISIAGKKYESAVMNLIPLFIIVYMWFFSADFMKPMYHNLTGVIIMTIALLAYFLALFMSQKILQFE